MTRLKPNIVEVGTIDLTEVDNAVKLFYDLSKNGDNAIKKLKDSLFATLFRIGRRFIPTGDLKLNNYPHLNILTVYILGNPEIYVMTVEDGHIYRTDSMRIRPIYSVCIHCLVWLDKMKMKFN